MNAVTISSKYQVVIPRQLREQFNLKPGNKIMFIPYNHTLRVVVIPSIEQARGMFEGIDTDPQREKIDQAV
ncbi:MAG: AbrB/MazE/SpoVT family DNA-binding domain-containing protein [Anaerolineales bacterium]|nr:AbrB/MazE/SpoVT family DNA-binding domain-containing protein [Anaerolineales bacterium]